MPLHNEIPLTDLVPELDELIGASDTLSADRDAQRQFAAVLMMTTSLLIGLIGSLLFHATPLGFNAFIYVALCMFVAFGLLIYWQRPMVFKHAAFAIPAACFALLLGVRLVPELVFLNTVALLGSLLVVIHFTGTTRFLGGHWTILLQRTAETLIVGWIESLREVVPDMVSWATRSAPDSPQITTLRSVLRGVIITLPVIAVFTLLFSSADAVFGDFAWRAVSFFLPGNMGDLIDQSILLVLFAGMFLVAVWTMQHPSQDKPATIWLEIPQFLRLNMIEATTVLGSVNFLFVTFVAIQARYFFGGETNITAQGYTYAEYARRGFYELLMVSFITMLLLITLETLTHRKREEENLFRGLVVLLVALTFVILVAAFQRLSLYASAYGYTRIRVMSGTFMIWLGLLLGVLLVAILRHRRDIFWNGCMITAMGFILTLNVMNLDGFIASHNIARFEKTGKLDVSYLLSLSDDAVPTVVKLLDNEDLSLSDHDRLIRGLTRRLVQLDEDRATRDMFGYHVGKARAWQALDDHRDILNWPYSER